MKKQTLQKYRNFKMFNWFLFNFQSILFILFRNDFPLKLFQFEFIVFVLFLSSFAWNIFCYRSIIEINYRNTPLKILSIVTCWTAIAFKLWDTLFDSSRELSTPIFKIALAHIFRGGDFYTKLILQVVSKTWKIYFTQKIYTKISNFKLPRR